ncbi:helix-turn-helix domain-containing protein [Duganella callida]|nr:helix-turn-helix domain-containing protein [Duganella callida]
MPTPLLMRSHFSVANELPGLQAQAWCDYVGRIMDVQISRSQHKTGFAGEIYTYVLKDLIFLDSRTDAFCQTRSAACQSRDTLRDYVFHVAVDGIIETTLFHGRQRKAEQFVPGVLALDMAQTMRMARPTAARVLAFFLPRPVVEAAIRDAPSIHGRVIGYNTPLTQLLFKQLQALCHRLPRLDDSALELILRNCAELMLAAFSKQARLEAGARNAVRTAMKQQICRYINANLYLPELTVEHLLQSFPLTRPSLYRLFEPEGGIAAYIRNCRLREAANEILLSPSARIGSIGQDLGFQDAAHFSRAFRRAYGMAPVDFRALDLDWTRA